MSVEKLRGSIHLQQPGLCKEAFYKGGARHMFDEMAVQGIQLDAMPNRILKIMIHHAWYPMTEKVLHQVFVAYGVVEDIDVSQGTSTVAAMVMYASRRGAEEALSMLNGCNIYDGCCQLHIEFAPLQDQEMDSEHHIFNKKASQQKVYPGCVLHVMVSRVLYPVTEDVLWQVFRGYGVERISMLQGGPHVEACVKLQSQQEVERARDDTHGRCIYDGCCVLDVQCMPLTPCDSVVATSTTTTTTTPSTEDDPITAAPTTYSTLGLDIDTGADHAAVASLLMKNMCEDVPVHAESMQASSARLAADVDLNTDVPTKYSTVCLDHDTNALASASITTNVPAATLAPTMRAITTSNPEHVVMSLPIMNDIAMDVTAPTPTKCSRKCLQYSVDADVDTMVLNFRSEVPSKYLTMELGQSMNNNTLVVTPLRTAGLNDKLIATLEWYVAPQLSFHNMCLVSFDSWKVFEEVCKGSSMRFWLPLLYWIERKQWPPSLRAEGMTDQSNIRPAQGPLYESEQCSIQLKPPWPSFFQESELHHDGKISKDVFVSLCIWSHCKFYLQNARFGQSESGGWMFIPLVWKTSNEAMVFVQSGEIVHCSVSVQAIRQKVIHQWKHKREVLKLLLFGETPTMKMAVLLIGEHSEISFYCAMSVSFTAVKAWCNIAEFSGAKFQNGLEKKHLSRIICDTSICEESNDWAGQQGTVL